MSEYELTSFLLKNIQDFGIGKLTSFSTSREARLYREIGTSSYIADICISINTKDGWLDSFNNDSVEFVAIEVKISDWESGLYQAWRYKNFAEKSYLAIYKPYAKDIKLEEFKSNNIGLIVFDESSLEVLFRPRQNSFDTNTYEAGVREKIWSKLFNTQHVYPTGQECT